MPLSPAYSARAAGGIAEPARAAAPGRPHEIPQLTPPPIAMAPRPPAAKPVAPSNSGLLHSAVAGRTDHLKVNVPAGSYVIPADVVSGTGEGNTLSGARILQHIFEGDGAELPERAKGGGVDPPVPILGAGGEYVVHPQHLARKFGTVSNGHKVMDKWVVQKRKQIAQEMLKLPGPVKN